MRRSKKGTDRRRALFSTQQNLIYSTERERRARPAQCWLLCVYIYICVLRLHLMIALPLAALLRFIALCALCVRTREINFMGVSLCVQREMPSARDFVHYGGINLAATRLEIYARRRIHAYFNGHFLCGINELRNLRRDKFYCLKQRFFCGRVYTTKVCLSCVTIMPDKMFENHQEVRFIIFVLFCTLN